MRAPIRELGPNDEQSWLRCRALGFLYTAYFDDVVTRKPGYDGPAVELVAEIAGEIVGLIDVEIAGELATIETIAVHAWTRDDEPANRWYLANGFRENYRYLHVYASSENEAEAAMVEVRPGLTAVTGYFHAEISNEEAIRGEFSRVHICRQYIRGLDTHD